MKFKSLQKVHAGKFIDRYDIVYETADGNDKVYEMISRDHDIDTADDPFAQLTRPHNDSVILVVTDEAGERLLISKEYRMACGHWVYNFVAGLIDPGESPEESAKRELWEETGLELYEIDDTLDKGRSPGAPAHRVLRSPHPGILLFMEQRIRHDYQQHF